MDWVGTNFDDQIACGAGNAAIGLGGNDWLYSISGTGPMDQLLVGGAGNDTYTALPNSGTVILEKGGGYDVLNVSIYAGSMYSYIYTIGWDLLMMGDYGTGCTIMIPDVTDYSIETINFLDASFNFKDFVTAARYGMENLGVYDSDLTYYLYNLGEAYAAAAERPEYIGENYVLPPAPPAPEPTPPAPPTAVDMAVAQYFNAAQYLHNKTTALQAEGMVMTVEATASAITAAGLTPWEHYRAFGAFERNANGELGIDPGTSFDTSQYYEAKSVQCGIPPEQLAALFQSVGLDPVTHYALYGRSEGLQPQPVAVFAMGLNEASGTGQDAAAWA